LIETEYLPKIVGLDGFPSYTLVDLGNDEISSLGIFTSGQRSTSQCRRAHLDHGNSGPFVASPLDARAASVLIHYNSD
jgi:hypothetical protein